MSDFARPGRLSGLDFARALAIFGMVFVNFAFMQKSETAGLEFLRGVLDFISGKAAATFVVLAGIGLALLSQRARESGDPQEKRRTRIHLGRRALFLLVIGLSLSTIWQPDILHIYAVFITFSTFVLFVPHRVLIALMFAAPLIFMGLLASFNFETGWDLQNSYYTDFWTWAGMVRHIFFNGFYPFFPWVSFLLLGMWLGRLPLHETLLQRKLILYGALAFLVSQALVGLVDLLELDLSAKYKDLFEADPALPGPFFLGVAGGSAVFVIGLSLRMAQWPGFHRWSGPFQDLGRSALSVFVLHVVIGILIAWTLRHLGLSSVNYTAATTLAFCGLMLCLARLWVARFGRGPIESLMRTRSPDRSNEA